MKRIEQESVRRMIGRIALREGAGNGQRSWYSIKAKGTNDETDVYLYDEISMWGIQAEQFVKDLNDITASTINLRINSPGGNVFDGTAIFNAIERHPAKVITYIDGIAASMASVIALSGDEVKMAKNAFFMIHNPWGLCIGDADDMRKEAEVLDKILDSMAAIYVRKSGQSEKQIRQWCDEETWFLADEAKDAGFVAEVIEAPAVEAKFDLSVFSKVPETLKGKPTNEWSERDFEGFLRDAGFSRKEAAAIVGGGFRAINQRDSDMDAEAIAESIKKMTDILKGAMLK